MNYLTCSLLNNEEIKTIKKELNISNQNWEDDKTNQLLTASLVSELSISCNNASATSSNS